MKRLFSLLGILFLVAAPAFGQEKKTKPAKADPGATKLLAEARAARAVWKDFRGFTADLVVNNNGKVMKGQVKVSPQGKVTLDLPKSPITPIVHHQIDSLVDHRLFSGEAQETPCAYADKNAKHPRGRKIIVLNDELHSSYRVRDRQITEVSSTRDNGYFAFTITVLENTVNAEMKFLPASYIVNTWWDIFVGEGAGLGARFNKVIVLATSRTHHNTWQRIGSFDLPAQITIVTASRLGQGVLDSVQMSFSNFKLGKK